jgi:hypothetical protein
MQQSYFVPESEIAKYNDDEFVMEEVPGSERGATHRKKYEKGTFIYRLAGRDRQKSASYYTPECLTQCVVKYALKELLKGRSADDILKLTICEPAMGSGAFLNEAINQLSDAYLERKQKETDQKISPGDYREERQKVKAYLATHNCYGVDLNPIATELAKVSLWLNTIYENSRCPWFGLRLAVGNSMIGARRQVFKADDLKRKKSKDNPNWLGLVPEHVPLGPAWQDRPRNSVYHFLVPDEGMAAFDSDNVIKELAQAEVKAIKEWRKEFCKPFDKGEVAKLIELSNAVDALWKQVIQERSKAARQTNQPIPIWGQEPPKENPLSIPAQEKVAAELERYYTAYRRLKLAMDYWCALWFWPIPEAAKLPSRDELLFDMELILKGTIQTPHPDALLGQLFPGEPVNTEHVQFVGRFGMVNIDELLEKNERLRIVYQVAQEIRFHHWELRFADLFAERGGFDLIVGNPPWVKVEWNESGFFFDIEPLFALRDLSTTQIAGQRNGLLTTAKRLCDFEREFVAQDGSKNYINGVQNYPLLVGVQANLYKCFLTLSWVIGSGGCTVGIIHQEGVFDDPKGGLLRQEMYRRLAYRFHFKNELLLFDISNQRPFEISISRSTPASSISFYCMFNLFHPATIDGSMIHDGNGAIPGIKTEDNHWDLRPHRSRLIEIDLDQLRLFARLYASADETVTQSRLPAIHSDELLHVLEVFAKQSRRLADMANTYFATQHFKESYARDDGTIRWENRYPRGCAEWVISGPHFFVANPFGKIPNDGCENNLDYSNIDLVSIEDDFLPRTNYVPACSADEYLRRTPAFNRRPITEFFRLAFRNMISPSGERTLIGAIIPPLTAHVHSVKSYAFTCDRMLCLFASLTASLPFDYFVRSSGRSGLQEIPELLPVVSETTVVSELLIEKSLQLNCLTCHYASLWESVTGTPWHRFCALRTDRERRMALVELDTLAALALNLTEEELVTIYRVQFPVLRQYERENLYDQTGRLIPKGVLDLATRNNIDIQQPLIVASFRGPVGVVGEVETPGLGVTGGIVWEDPKMEPRMKRVYPPPFTKCDREADMRQAYRAFQERIRSQEKAP